MEVEAEAERCCQKPRTAGRTGFSLEPQRRRSPADTWVGFWPPGPRQCISVLLAFAAPGGASRLGGRMISWLHPFVF